MNTTDKIDGTSRRPSGWLAKLRQWLNKLLKREQGGQGIVEYAFVIAFVSILIMLAFSMTRGSLFAAISNTYSNVTSTLDRLNRASGEVSQP